MKRSRVVFISLGVVIGLVIAFKLFFASKRARRSLGGVLWDPASELRLQSLHPAIQSRVREFINAAEDAGLYLRITSGYRSFAEQDKLYAQGRTAPGDIVTNAKGGQSYHNYGLSFDVVPMVKGLPVWDSAPLWAQIGALGKSYGFAWGGDWKNPDKPHFEKSYGLSVAQLYTKSVTEKTPYINVA